MKFEIVSTCPACGELRKSLDKPEEKICGICGKSFEAEETCGTHYICYDCTHRKTRDKMIEYCLSTAEKDPVALATQLMQLPGVPIHGPVHHLLLPATLLTAFYNETKAIELKAALQEADKRSIEVPGAACAHWGACGAAIGTGMFVSILKDVGPLSLDTWREVGQLTAKSIDKISGLGGPRCCKRDSYLALAQAVAYSNESLGTHFPTDTPSCIFYSNNRQCKGKACPFFPAFHKIETEKKEVKAVKCV